MGTPGARDWPQVDVQYVDLGLQWEITRWHETGTVIYLHEELLEVRQRAALTHALEHLDRGAPCTGLMGRIERAVEKATALYLLPDLDLIARMLSAYDARRTAHELGVPWGILVDRLRGLTDEELEFVTRRVEHVA